MFTLVWTGYNPPQPFFGMSRNDIPKTAAKETNRDCHGVEVHLQVIKPDMTRDNVFIAEMLSASNIWLVLLFCRFQLDYFAKEEFYTT